MDTGQGSTGHSGKSHLKIVDITAGAFCMSGRICLVPSLCVYLKIGTSYLLNGWIGCNELSMPCLSQLTRLLFLILGVWHCMLPDPFPLLSQMGTISNWIICCDLHIYSKSHCCLLMKICSLLLYDTDTGWYDTCSAAQGYCGFHYFMIIRSINSTSLPSL